MRAKHTALILTAGFLLLPTLSWSQFPGMGGGGGDFGGRPTMRGNPDMLFNMLSGGRDVINVDQMDPQSRSMFDKFGPMLGLGGNQITREQFSSAMSRVREMAAQGSFGGMNFRMGGGGGGGAPMMFTMPGGGDKMGGMPGGGEGGNDRGIEEYFNRLDVNEDGVLDRHELTGDRVAEALASEFDKYDLDHNNMIDLPEFKAYMKARRGDARNPNAPDAAADEEKKKRPTVFRAGNLPNDFPYAMFDTDGDGQIGLYEWKAAGKRLGDFLAMDLNNDGFLTVDEYYRWKKNNDEKNGVSGGSQFARGGRGMQGMPGGNLMAMNMNGMPGGMNFDRPMIPGGFGGGDRQRGPGGFGSGGGDRQRGPGGFGSGGELGMAMPGRFGGDQYGGGQRNFGQFPGMGMGGDQYGGGQRNRGQFPGGGNFGGGGGAMPGFNPGVGGPFTPPGGDRQRGPGGDNAGGERPMRKGGFNNGGQGNGGENGGRPTRKGGFGGGGGGGRGPGRTR